MKAVRQSQLLQTQAQPRALCATLVILMLTGPLVAYLDEFSAQLMTHVAFALVFLSGPVNAAKNDREWWLTTIFAASALLTGLFSPLLDELVLVDSVLSATFFAYLCYLTARNLFRAETTVTDGTLWTAVNTYIIAGMFFAFLYNAVNAVLPHAFAGQFLQSPVREGIDAFIYFSFATLTTVGYGDLTPNHVFVATLAYMEALFGQLYLAILVARLVGLYSASNKT